MRNLVLQPTLPRSSLRRLTVDHRRASRSYHTASDVAEELPADTPTPLWHDDLALHRTINEEEAARTTLTDEALRSLRALATVNKQLLQISADHRKDAARIF